MLKNLKHKLRRNFEIFSLIALLILTAVSTSIFNYKKSLSNQIYDNFIENIYLKKTLKHIVQNLKPKYQKIKHKIEAGETFDKILEKYKINKKEIIKIKNSLKKKINLNKLNTKQVIQFTLDKTTDKITEFTYQISNTQKIFLKRNIKNDNFKDEIIPIKL